VHRIGHGSSDCLGRVPMIEFLSFPALPTAESVGALKEAAENPENEGIILEFSGDEPDADAEIGLLLNGDQVIDSLRGVLRAIETKPKPLVGQIKGPLKGLALEISLACQRRIATSEAATRFGHSTASLPSSRLGKSNPTSVIRETALRRGCSDRQRHWISW
jgi:hypothetical protein